MSWSAASAQATGMDTHCTMQQAFTLASVFPHARQSRTVFNSAQPGGLSTLLQDSSDATHPWNSDSFADSCAVESVY